MGGIPPYIRPYSTFIGQRIDACMGVCLAGMDVSTDLISYRDGYPGQIEQMASLELVMKMPLADEMAVGLAEDGKGVENWMRKRGNRHLYIHEWRSL